jgi:hypothetical protein
MLVLGTLAPAATILIPYPASPDAGTFLALAANTVWVPVVFAFGIWITRPQASAEPTQLAQASRLEAIITILAKSSYAFYLLHIGPAANLVYLVAFHNNLLTFLALWVLSVGFNQIVENPILRIIRGKRRFH